MSPDEPPHPHPDPPGTRVSRALLLDSARRARDTATVARGDEAAPSLGDDLRKRAEQRGVIPADTEL